MSTHSTNVNCTLDKVNCTLCVRKHTILGPEVSYQTNITKLSFNLNAQCHEDYFPSFCVQSYAQSDNVSSIHWNVQLATCQMVHLPSRQLHISVNRTAQIYSELHFCVELHTKKAITIRSCITAVKTFISKSVYSKWAAVHNCLTTFNSHQIVAILPIIANFSHYHQRRINWLVHGCLKSFSTHRDQHKLG